MPDRARGTVPRGPLDNDARDERLAVLLNQLTDDLRGGATPDLEAMIRANPDLSQDLRELWSAVLVAEGIAAVASSNGNLPPSAAASDTDLRGGATLPRWFGDFELLSEVGRGGMGVVYQARQRSLERTVALKMILRGELASSSDLARFQHEAENAARLDHPHIVPVYEVNEFQGQPYFSMKYVEGTTLAQRLALGPIPGREAAAILSPICRAIHYAHERGVLHRDLKPSNILLDREGRAHVTDFGLAKRVESDHNSLTRTGAILGTPCHMAPEQAAGKRGRLGPASDVYSLGTILYQMLTGRPPFQAATAVETVLLVLEQDPLPPRLINPRADRELELIALRCLQKPPELRYESAEALANDLDAYLANEPIAARSGAMRQIVARWFRDTHHAVVLENWGLLWMWHSLALLVLCLITNWFHWQGILSPGPYIALWTAGLGTWAAIFWALRHRSGPVTFVERQIAHVWLASMISNSMLFVVEIILGLPVLTLSPIIAVISGMIFTVKAGILIGEFYIPAAALYLTAAGMAILQRNQIDLGVLLFGVVSAACFFFPGLKYHRMRRKQQISNSELSG